MSVPATLSPEGKLRDGLRELCSYRTFEDVARELGVRIAHGPFVEALNGNGKPFEEETAEKLLELLSRMKELKAAVHEDYGVEPNWSQTDQIVNALTTRLLASVAHEAADPDEQQFRSLADVATAAVRLEEEQ